MPAPHLCATSTTAILLLLGVGACGGDDSSGSPSDNDTPDGDTVDNGTDTPESNDQAPPTPYAEQSAQAGVAGKMSLTGSFFDRPFPFDAVRDDDGTWNPADFPDNGSKIVKSYKSFIDQVRGASPEGAIFAPFDGAIDTATLPADGHASLRAEAGVFVVNVDAASPFFGARHPVEVSFKTKGETLSTPNLLAALPIMGVALEEKTTYALIVTDTVKAPGGASLGATPEMATLLWALRQPGYVDASAAPGPMKKLIESSKPAWDWLTTSADRLSPSAPARPSAEALRHVVVFTTGDVTRNTQAVARHIIEQHGPTITPTTLTKKAEFPDFCAFEGTYKVPIFQIGTPPYKSEADREGRIEYDAQGVPIQTRTEEVRYSFSIPKKPMPERGYPFMGLAHGYGGNYYNALDRGPEGAGRDTGLGPALPLAKRGIAAGGIDAVNNGARHPTVQSGTANGLDFFNFFNPWVVSNNVKQSVADVMLYLRMLKRIEVAADQCPGATAGADGKFRFDAEHFFYMGHSLGTSISGVLGGVDPLLSGILHSGAGAGAISFVLSQKTPVDISGTAAALMGFDTDAGEELDRFDPLLTLMQYAFDEADGPNFAKWAHRDRPESWKPLNVFQIQGRGDTYTPELTNHTVAAGYHLDFVAGPGDPEGIDRVSYVGGTVRTPPFSANRRGPAGAYTAVIHPFEMTDRNPNGTVVEPHFVTFQLDGVKHVYTCFIRTAIDNGPGTVVPMGNRMDAPCE